MEAAASGLIVVSTRVGGVPEVLPPEMLVLADPSPQGVINAMDEAVGRVREAPINAIEQHQAVTKMYSWEAVARRTERVYYNAVRLERDDSMGARLQRYWLCGKWFGKICCCVAAVDWWYWQWLEMWDPRGKIKIEKEFPCPIAIKSK